VYLREMGKEERTGRGSWWFVRMNGEKKRREKGRNDNR
jgi:hypothetical protein